MKGPRALFWALVLSTAATAILLPARRATTARAEAENAQARLTIVHAQVQELVRLRAIAPDSSRRRPASRLQPRIAAVLTACGLPATSLSSLSPEPETPLYAPDGTQRLRRQRATLALSGLTLPQTGRFLDAWQQAEPTMVITTIDLSPQSAPSAPGAGSDLPLRVVLGIESVFIAEPVGPRATPVTSSLGAPE